jgi:hypothetical protein
MKKLSPAFIWILSLVMFVSIIEAEAQTENPRGIYKLSGINGKDGKYFKEPFDQYKLCGDKVTLTMIVQGNVVRYFKNDSKVFNYTGSEPASADDKSPLIYDSDANGFKLKWWSNYPNHPIFPSNDWCIETYRSSGFSKTTKAISDGLQSKYVSDKKKYLRGRWRMLGLLDDLNDRKKDTQRMKDRYAASRYYNRNFVVFGDKYMVENLNHGQAYYEEIEYIDNIGYKIIRDRFDDSKNEARMVTWISKDMIAVELKMDDYRTDYQILERMKDDKSILDYIFDYYDEH